MKKSVVLIAAILVTGLCSMRAQAQKIGYVNMQDLITSMPEIAKADTTLNKFQQELGQQNQAMQQEFASKAQAYVKDSSTLSDAVKQVKQAELRDLQNRMQEFQQGAQQQIQAKQAAVLKPIIEKAKAAVSAVAKSKGYTYVINDSENGDILVVRPAGDDLTPAVKAKLGLK